MSYRGARAPKNYETYNRSVNKYFDLINNLKSDEMNALKSNDNLTFTFYVTLSNRCQIE